MKDSHGTFLGLDLGSVSVKAVVIDGDGRILFQEYRRTKGRPLAATRGLFRTLCERAGDVPLDGGTVTGSGKGLLSAPLGLIPRNEIVAQATAAWTVRPEVRSIVEIGGQDSKFVRVGRTATGQPFVEDHAFNELCAAGTGAFLDQMAERLDLSIEEFGRLGAAAKRAARMAGRCSVFAKTDLIHLRQRACPTDEIVAGMCFSLVRSYLASLCHGRPPETPLMIQGGVAANGGVLRAFRELLGLDETQLFRPDCFKVMGALGAALLSREVPLEAPVSLAELEEKLDAIEEPGIAPSGLLPLLPVEDVPLDPASGSSGVSTGDVAVGNELYLGLDVGSVSTKAVIIDGDARLAASCYLPTGGQPVQAVHQVLEALRCEVPAGSSIRYAVSTGSGRHLARDLVRADEALDEISAQARSAVHVCPEVDTVFEIGGQDSKYMRVEEGRVVRFQMNRACAAGTGAFLEEQAGRLGTDIETGFQESALRSENPVRLGSRCTVFMDSDLVHHVQTGASTGDLCAGLAWSIARNYLDKVVGSRPVGSHVLFQGGVARNRAVQSALQQSAEGEFTVHPFPELSGAWGAALAGRDAVEGGAGETRFQGLAGTDPDGISIRTFECSSCENLCEIQQMTCGSRRTGREGSRRRSYFGSVCGRFEKGQDEAIPPYDAFATRERLLQGEAGDDGKPAPRGEIGFPMGLSMADHLPFWRTFFTTLGFRVRLSGASDRKKVTQGLARVPEEFCYPVKVLFGHAHHLLDTGTNRVFVPHLRQFTAPGETKAWYACPYTQAAPYVIRGSLRRAEVITLEYPVPGEMSHWVREAAGILTADEDGIRTALGEAERAQRAFREACRQEGDRVLRELEEDGRIGVVLLGRPYNTSDRHVNLNLARRIKALGMEPVPFDFLDLESEKLPAFWNRVRWGYGREQVMAAQVVRRNPRLAAVVVTNFGCGPDSFVDQYLEETLRVAPHIVLEFDDHQAEAGLVPRLEAFAKTCREWSKASRSNPASDDSLARDPGEPTRPLREYTYYVPFFSDHAHAYVGALRGAGCRAVLLPPTDDESWQLGLRHAYGRECHPYISFLGDLLKAARGSDFVPAESAYYGPSYFGPCLLPQYIVALKLVLRRIGLGGVIPLNIADPDTMLPLGRGYITRLGLGIYAIDRLYKWKVESEPYEEIPGEVDRVHRENLNAIEEGLAGGSLRRSLKESVERFSAVRLRPEEGTRPKVGVIGDVYTRVNEHANDDLYRRLEDLGFEVWTSCSLIDISLLGAEQLHAELARNGRPVAGWAARSLVPVVARLRGLVDRYFPDSIRTPQERQFPQVQCVADRVGSHWIDKLLSLNLSRVEEFHQAGAHGVVNAMCHNCMLGTVTSAFMKTMGSDIGGLSACSLIYEGLQSIHNVNRLEAFAHQLASSVAATPRE